MYDVDDEVVKATFIKMEQDCSTFEAVKIARDAIKEGELEKARLYLTNALENAPGSFTVHFELGVCYNLMDSLEDALYHFLRAHKLQPRDAKTLNNLGVIYYVTQNFKAAANSFVKAIEIEPGYVDALYGAAKTFFSLGNEQKSYQCLKKCLRYEPRHKAANNLIDIVGEKNDKPEIKSLRLGFVSVWFERGQAYVTKLIKDTLDENHQSYVFARTGGVYGKEMLETSGHWNVPNLTTYPSYQISPEAMQKWILDNQLDVVIFNEEYDWNLVKAAKSTNAVVITYLDYYKDDWRPFMHMYDAVLCSTFRTYDLVKNLCNAYYFGWAVDNKVFKPQKSSKKKYTFYHNAGWLGINFRKMTPAVIVAFDALSKVLTDITLLIHAQAELEKLPVDVQDIVKNNDRLEYLVKTVSAPGLYHKANVHIFPTKLEGLGLPLMEGLACGLPTIATDAPPMNEFVKDGYNGLLIKVGREIRRNDNIAFPETVVDMNDLAAKMKYLATHPQVVEKMKNNALRSVDENLSVNKMRTRLNDILIDVIKRAR